MSCILMIISAAPKGRLRLARQNIYFLSRKIHRERAATAAAEIWFTFRKDFFHNIDLVLASHFIPPPSLIFCLTFYTFVFTFFQSF